ncbi:glycosyltransferase family 4 protein [Bacillus timonensis]|nr:glycosyltransferase family 4 protein [Bacillus timonensis]
MKILVIWRLLTVGGVNAGWRNRAVYFKKYGIETEFMYVKDLGGMHIMEDVAPVYLTKNEDKIVQIIKENKYDVIIICDTKKGYEWLEKANYNGPLIIEARTPEILKLTRHLPNFDRALPDRIVVPSYHQKRLASILIDSNANYEVIYNGIDTDFFHPLKKEDLHVTVEPRIPTNKKILAYIGRLDGRKNWKLFLKVVKLIEKERDDIEFWIIGGAKSVGRDEFEYERKRQGLTEIVKWFPVVPYQEMPQVYGKVRESGGCTLATTKGESFGNTFIEAMACGVPVVAPSISSIPEIVVDGGTGAMYKEENPRDAVRKIYEIVDNAESYEEMSKAARDIVVKKFSLPICAEQYVKLLQSLAGVAQDETC